MNNMENKVKTQEEIIKEIDKDYDPYVSHTFSHWVRDLEEFNTASKYERYNKKEIIANNLG